AGLVAVGHSFSTGASWRQVVPGLFVYGFGVGRATAQLTSVILKDVPSSESGHGPGGQSTPRPRGYALCVAILATILFTSLGSGLQARLDDRASIPADSRTQIVDAVVVSAGSAIPGLEAQSPDAAADAREAFTDATRYATFSAAGFL